MSRRLRLAYKRHFLEAELILSVILTAVIMAFILLKWGPEELSTWISQREASLYPLAAMIGTTLLGFVITGVSIILAFSESPNLSLLKRSKQHWMLFHVYFDAIKYLAIMTILSIVGIVVNDHMVYPIFALWLWSAIVSALRVWRCVWVLKNLVEIVARKE